MNEEKTALFALWLGLVFATCALPFALLPARFANPRFGLGAPGPVSRALGWAVLSCALIPFMFGGVIGIPLALALVFAAPLLTGSRETMLGGLAALVLMASAMWWAHDPWLAWPAALAFVAIGALAALAPRRGADKTGLPLAPTLCALLVAAFAPAVLTGQFGASVLFWMLWHHWGAYVAPVQALLAGGEPFRDFPLQYGMGPTLTIAALGGKDPWAGAFAAVAAFNALYLLAMAGCVGLTLRRAPRGLALLAMLALVAAALLWAGYPIDFSGPMITPSVGGLRFLPLALLLLVIVWGEARARPIVVPGALLWLLGLAWSPEAGIYATIVWFPYLGLRAAQAVKAETRSAVVGAALRGAALAVASLAAGGGLLALAFRACFGDWPSASGYLVYILNPPGPLPINPFGPVWLLAGVLGVGALALARANGGQARAGLAILLGLLAVSSYYLGRSHDNNLLNLFPFVALLLAFTLSVDLPPALHAFSRMALVGLVAWPATFNFTSLTAKLRDGEPFAFGSARLLERFTLATPDAQRLLDDRLARVPPLAPTADAAAALAWLERQKDAAAPLVVNKAMIAPRLADAPAWTGVNNLANFDPLPREIVARFIRNGANAYKRTGWLLVDRGHAGDWLDRFQAAYVVAETRDFGAYTLYRLEPRPN